jgi:hypothetical protein
MLAHQDGGFSQRGARVDRDDLASANGGNRHGGSRIEEVTGNEVIQSPLSLHPIALDQMKATGFADPPVG